MISALSAKYGLGGDRKGRDSSQWRVSILPLLPFIWAPHAMHFDEVSVQTLQYKELVNVSQTVF
jgi:hypothetical protein